MSVQTSEPGFTLHKLKHDDYHEICGLVERVKSAPPDVRTTQFEMMEGHFIPGSRVMTADGISGEITGFAVDAETMKPTPFARVNGRLYHVSTLKRA